MRLSDIAVVLLAVAPLCGQETIHRRVEVAAPAGVVGIEAGQWSGAVAGGFETVSLHGPGIRFDGPPKAGAPYSAEAVTETVQVLSDGNRIAREHRAKVFRDSQGRTRREEKLDVVGPWAVSGEQPERVFINDPVAGVHWVLEPEKKLARKMTIPSVEDHLNVTADVAVNVEVDVEAKGSQSRTRMRHQSVAFAGDPADAPAVEELGVRMVEGVEAKGVKITRTIPAGQIGNQRPIEIIFERWTSEELGVDVMTKRSDPRAAETTYRLTNIQRTEPLPGLFEPPPDYTVDEGGGNVMFERRVFKTTEDK